MKLRLDKYLADMGLGTRSEVKQAVRKGRVQVNGQTVREPEYKTDTETDQVWFNGQPAAYREYEYYMLNKPAGVISASEDPRERCVVDLIESRKRKDLFPVGRLDKDTEGLLLITNDGGLAHRLLYEDIWELILYTEQVSPLLPHYAYRQFLYKIFLHGLEPVSHKSDCLMSSDPISSNLLAALHHPHICSSI